jgi:hypothetical protein
MLTTKKNISKLNESTKESIKDAFIDKSENTSIIKSPTRLNNVFSTNKQPYFSDNEKLQSQVNRISEMIKSEKQLKQIEPHQIVNKNIVCNVINPDDPSTIMVKFDNEIFSFYDNKKSHLGSFTIKQLLKYIVQDNEFLVNTGMGTSQAIIETFICKNQQNKIRIYDHIASIFMGNLEMLIKLNNSLFKYEKMFEKMFEKDISMCNKKCLLKIKAFNFTLLNHTLKIISTISNEYNMNNVEIKNKLLRYSVGIVYRLINYIRERFTTNIDNTKIIHDNIKKLIKTRNDLTNHINLLSVAIIQQSHKINTLIEKMDETTNQVGGVKTESSTEKNKKYNDNDEEISNEETNNEEISNEETNDEEISNEETNDEEISNEEISEIESDKMNKKNDIDEEEYKDDFSGALTMSKSKLTTSEYLKNSSDEQNIEDFDDYIDTEGNGYESNTEQENETSDKRLQITSETESESEYSKIENLTEEII